MNTVPLSAIDDAWHELYDSTEERAGELMDAFAKEQPELAAYLSGAEEEINTLDDRGFLMLYGVWAWLAFKLNGRDDTMVTATSIDAAANRNHEDMSRLGNASQSLIMDASRGFRKEFRQMPMLGAIVNDVAEGQMESQHRNDDITGIGEPATPQPREPQPRECDADEEQGEQRPSSHAGKEPPNAVSDTRPPRGALRRELSTSGRV